MMPNKRVLQGVGYGLFALVSLALSFYWTFPAAALGQRLSHEVEVATGGVWHIAFNEVSTYHFTGIQADGVTLRRTGAGEPLILQIDALRARVRILPLFLFRVSLDTELALGDGTLAARLTPRGQGLEARLGADTVNLAVPPLVSKFAGIPVGGTVQGTVEVNWDNEPGKTQGNINLQVAKSSIGPGSVAGLSVPMVELGDLDLAADIKDGKLKITTFKQKGGNIALQAGGTVQLMQPAIMSNLDVCLQFKADPAFLNANPKIRTLLQLAEVQLKKDSESFIHLPLSGPIATPQMRGGQLCRRGG